MSRLDGLRYRLRTLLFRRTAEQEVDDELDFHLGLESIHAPTSPREKLGNVTYLKEEIRMQSSRHWLDVLRQDLRFAARTLRRHPGFAAGATLTLALGIGATTAIVSVLDAVVIRPLPYPDAHRLVAVWSVNTTVDPEPFSSSPPDFRELATARRTIEGIAAHYAADFSVETASGPTRLEGARVSPSFFTVLGVAPSLGRGFTEEEGVHGRHRVAVISDRLWRRQFGGERDVIGRSLRIDREPYEIVGVASPTVRFPHERVDLWLPMAFAPGDNSNTRGNYFLEIVARLRIGSTLEEGTTELDAIARRVFATVPQASIRGAMLRPLQGEIIGSARTPLLVLSGAIALVLLIACANVAGLLLARGTARVGEMALRANLGADRGRLLRQLMTEHLTLGIIGGLLGTLFASAGIAMLIRLAPTNLPRIQEAALNGRVLSATFVIVLITTLLFGLAPALRLSRADAGTSLRETRSSPGRGRGRAHAMLVAIQMALSLMLLAGAGLLLRSFARVLEVDPGFRTEHVLTMSVDTPEEVYPTPERLFGFIDDAVTRLAAIPGVRSSAATSALSLGGGSWGKLMTIAGRPPDPSIDAVPTIAYRLVSHGYFETMGVAARRGRVFAPTDRRGTPGVAILNEAAVRRYWPTGNPIGETIWLGPPEEMVSSIIPAGYRFPRLQVIGIVADERFEGLDQPPEPEIYQLYEQVTETPSAMYFVLRSDRAPDALASAVRATIKEIDPEQPIADVATMQERVQRATQARRFALVLLALFAAVALVLSAVGLYGVISYTVAERRREIAVRMAVGASASGVLLLVIRRGLRPVVAGVAVGLAGTLGLSRVLDAMLFGISRTDPLTLGAVVLVLFATAIVACLIPAWRGARTAPMEVLRME